MILIYGDLQQWEAMSAEQQRTHDGAQAAFSAAAAPKIIGGKGLEQASPATTLRPVLPDAWSPRTGLSSKPRRCSAVTTYSKPPT
jgi:hypothetical protein